MPESGDTQGHARPRGWARYRTALRAYVQTPQFLGLALVAILLLGASMRFTGVNWDEQTHLHPDERFLTDVTTKLGWPASLAEYFSEATSPLNPHNRGIDMFVYGTLPIFITKGLGILLDQGSYWQVHLVGRVVSGCYDLAVVALVFFLGRRLYGRWVGLLAAFLMACTALSIQHSHFYTVETFTTLLVTLAIFFTIRVVQDGGWANWALTGATFGMAVAGKISVATYMLIIGVAALLRLQRAPAVLAAATDGATTLWRRRLGGVSISMQMDGDAALAPRRAALMRGLVRVGLGLALAGLAALVAFRVTQPYAFTGPSPFSLQISPRWLQQDVLSAGSLVNGSVDFPPSHQWTDREPILFAWRNIVLWGMGLPLGLAAWLGWLVALIEIVRWRKLEHLLLMLWVTMTFVYQSVQFVKSIRYFLPIYPLLVILAAYFVVWLWRQGQALAERVGGTSRAAGVGGAEVDAAGGSRTAPTLAGRLAGRAPLAAGLLGAVVLAGTFLYAEAFTNIYRRPLSRVEASRWVYANIPAGSSITWERWDDIIPQNIDGKDAGSLYHLVDTDPYWEDSPEKREALYQWLDEADYIILSSNRVYDSVSRLPERFPLTNAYYKYLFSGELGFDTIKVFTSYPDLGPIQFVDDTADEAFSVYDHPKVIILKKTPRYSSALAHQLLDDIEVERLMRLSPLASMASHHGLMLSPEEQQAQQAGGTWRAMFDPASLANQVPIIAWLVVLELLALIAFPLAFVAFRRFRDRGYIFAKSLGVLGVAYLAWLGASLHLVPYTRAAILAFAFALLLLAAGLAWRRWDEMHAFFAREWRRLLFEEALFLAFFGAFLLVRLGNPDLWHPVMGGEKPMDFAYLNAIIKSTWFPPYDPWFAGGYVNYYYFGQVIVATLIKLSGVIPDVAYNLALPTLFALTAMGGYAAVDGLLGSERGRLLDRAARSALFAALLIAVLGNLGQVRLLLQGLWQASGSGFRSTIPGLEGLVNGLAGLYQVALAGRSLDFRPEWWYWNASRVMGAGEINEFPFFTFLYADLHAHLIALPFGLLALGLVVSLVRNRAVGPGQADACLLKAPGQEPPPLTPPPQTGAGNEGNGLLSGGFAARQQPSEKNRPFPVHGEGAGGWGTAPAGEVQHEDSRSPSAAGLSTAEGVWARLRRWASSVDWGEWLALGLLALTLGELRANNTWDYPTYLLLALGGLALAHVLRAEGVAWRGLWAVAGRGLALFLASTLLFAPFLGRYGAAYTSLELWRGERTPPGEFLIIHGVFLAILVTYALSRAFGYQAHGALARMVRLSLGRPLRVGRTSRLAGLLVAPTAGFQFGWVGMLTVMGISALSLLAGWWVPGLVLPLIAVGLALVLRRDPRGFVRSTDLPPAERFAAMLFTLGLALTLAVEVVVLKGDIGRMNTVFKFYLQVWVLWGVAAAVALSALASRWARWPAVPRRLWQGGLAVLLFGAALYPLTATWGKINDRFDPSTGPTLDGTAYAATAVYNDGGQALELQADMAAIDWLRQNIDGSPVILEGNAPLYRWGSRISVYTGLPTVIGWDWHEKQQRAIVPADVVGWRLADVSTLYNGTDRAAVARLLRLYAISYVYVGQLEQAYYDAQGLAKFAAWADFFTPVYQQGPVTIYQVRQESLGGLSSRPFPQGRSAAATSPSPRPLPQGERGSEAGGGGSPTQPAGGPLPFPPQEGIGWDPSIFWAAGQAPSANPTATGSPTVPPQRGNGRGAPSVGSADGSPMLDGPVDQLPLVDDRGWNPLANAGPLAAALTWWLAVAALGWAAWPLCLGACRGLPDRGYLAAKALGWLLVGYILWLGASTRLVSNTVPYAYGGLAVVAAAGAWAACRRRRELAALWRARRGLLLREELLFSGAFAALVLVRLLNPDLWQPWFGGEKMMEFAYLNAILKSAHFPPYDPYFAGGSINYYYYGLYLVSVLVKLTGVVPEVAFNLAVPTFYALTVGNAFSFGHALTARLRGRRWLWGGLAAAIGVALLGNLTVLVQWLASMVSAGGAVPAPTMGLEALVPLVVGAGRWLSGRGALQPFDYWYQATRIIPFTINEFPFFSYLFADLHPHMMAVPFTIAALALVASRLLQGTGNWRVRSARGPTGSMLRSHPENPHSGWEPGGGVAQSPAVPRAAARTSVLWRTVIAAAALVPLALVLGALGPMNTWDLPTYLGLALLVLIWQGFERGQMWRGLAEALGVALLAGVLYLPFYAHYAAPGAALRLLAARTGLRYFAAVWGLWLVALYGWLAARWWRGREGVGRLWHARFGTKRARRLLAALGGRVSPRLRLRRAIVAGAALLALAALLGGEAVAAVLLPLVALALDLWLRRDVRPAERLAGLVAAWACAILAGSEFVYLADFLQGGEWQRMNTVFKFGMQAWVLVALAAAVGLAALARSEPARGRAAVVSVPRLGLRLGWSLALVGLVAVSLAYVPLGVAARVQERFPGGPPPTGTLDGMAYMKTGVYDWPDEDHAIELRYDYEAIEWLLANVHGTPVIAEAPLGYYREGGMRVSSYTGLPTLVGMHQNEQRPAQVVAERTAQAERLYRSTSALEALDLMRQLRVQFVYFGQLEENVYGPASRAKFDALVQQGALQVLYSNPGVAIYKAEAGPADLSGY